MWKFNFTGDIPTWEWGINIADYLKEAIIWKDLVSKSSYYLITL